MPIKPLALVSLCGVLRQRLRALNRSFTNFVHRCRIVLTLEIAVFFSGQHPLRRLALLTLVAGALSGAAVTVSASEDIRVESNQARILRLARPADTIVIGNPSIVDAVVQDSRTVILTGKGFGVTNIVIIDADGEPILDEQVVVSRSTASTTRIYRQANVQTL
ncbi:hypothetical protein G3A39_44540, partial [Paraburkholderia aspalathi]|nr:hypothetical protein [Paraburkholderia aspalathi]